MGFRTQGGERVSLDLQKEEKRDPQTEGPEAGEGQKAGSLKPRKTGVQAL